jgi:hypothetical protein
MIPRIGLRFDELSRYELSGNPALSDGYLNQIDQGQDGRLFCPFLVHLGGFVISRLRQQWGAGCPRAQAEKRERPGRITQGSCLVSLFLKFLDTLINHSKWKVNIS